MKNKYITVGIIPKSYLKIIETETKSIPLTHMSSHFPSLVQVLQLKSGRVKLVLSLGLNKEN
jgi:hypothetical protein